MKSVALTEGKKAYFYDLNRQFGIKRNFSPKIRHTAELQQAAWNVVIHDMPGYSRDPGFKEQAGMWYGCMACKVPRLPCQLGLWAMDRCCWCWRTSLARDLTPSLFFFSLWFAYLASLSIGHVALLQQPAPLALASAQRFTEMLGHVTNAILSISWAQPRCALLCCTVGHLCFQAMIMALLCPGLPFQWKQWVEGGWWGKSLRNCLGL